MAVKIRLQRRGSKHAPKYSIVATESSSPRDGRFIEKLGFYNPVARGQEEEVRIDLELVDKWLGFGAQPSDTAKALIKKARKAAAAAA